MTEQEWLYSDDPQEMLRQMNANPDTRVPYASERKLRLFACACARLWGNPSGGELAAIEALEKMESGSADYAIIDSLLLGNPVDWARWHASTNKKPEKAALLRDFFGNAWRTVAFNHDWLTWHNGIILLMARTFYEEHDFDGMPILADALEEAGCTDEYILMHCRGWRREWETCGQRGHATDCGEWRWVKSDAPHVRGCWVIDLLLGKE